MPILSGMFVMTATGSSYGLVRLNENSRVWPGATVGVMKPPRKLFAYCGMPGSGTSALATPARSTMKEAPRATARGTVFISCWEARYRLYGFRSGPLNGRRRVINPAIDAISVLGAKVGRALAEGLGQVPHSRDITT